MNHKVQLITFDVQEIWAADAEIAGPYLSSRVGVLCADALFFSLTAVLMDSTDNTRKNPEGGFQADYDLHPHSEFNFNVAITLGEGAALAGPNRSCYGGWTEPGSSHFPKD